jgi:tellurite resistance protein TerC
MVVYSALFTLFPSDFACTLASWQEGCFGFYALSDEKILGINSQNLSESGIFWVGFHLLLLGLLSVDFFLFRRKKQALREACLLSAFWIVAALLFNGLIYKLLGSTSALEFLTGYLVEKSLSVDNLFVFTLIFAQFGVAPAQRYPILFWGILGALILRVALILGGLSLVGTFHWIFYVLGLVLMISALKLGFERKQKKRAFPAALFRLLSRIFPLADSHQGGQFVVKERGRWKVTSLFLVLLIIEGTDLIFALDSIPAIFAITTDPFIAYTSNVFAILGLRSLYFVVAGSLDRLRYFKWGLCGILLFAGVKMVLTDIVHISALPSLGVILGILALTVGLSVRKKS